MQSEASVTQGFRQIAHATRLTAYAATAMPSAQNASASIPVTSVGVGADARAWSACILRTLAHRSHGDEVSKLVKQHDREQDKRVPPPRLPRRTQSEQHSRSEKEPHAPVRSGLLEKQRARRLVGPLRLLHVAEPFRPGGSARVTP